MPGKQFRELVELKVSAVALVDEPANRRPFFIVKRKGEHETADAEGTMKRRRSVKKDDAQDPTQEAPVERQAVVVSEEQRDAALEALDGLVEAVGRFRDLAAGKTGDQGMIIFTDEDLAPWAEVAGFAGQVDSAFGGGAPPEAPAEPEMNAEDEEDMRMAKYEERISDLEEAVLLLIQSQSGAVGKDAPEADGIVDDGEGLEGDLIA